MSNPEYAFPHDNAAHERNGMTLRDYFAAKAMAAMIAHHGIYDEDQAIAAKSSATVLYYDAATLTDIAYTYADEMMIAREQDRHAAD